MCGRFATCDVVVELYSPLRTVGTAGTTVVVGLWRRKGTAREQLPSLLVPGACASRAEVAEAVNRYLYDIMGQVYALDGHYVAKLERGVVRWPNRAYRAGLRYALAVASDSDLGFVPPRRAEQRLVRNTSEAAGDSNEVVDVNRKQFLTGAFGIGTGDTNLGLTLHGRTADELPQHAPDAARVRAGAGRVDEGCRFAAAALRVGHTYGSELHLGRGAELPRHPAVAVRRNGRARHRDRRTVRRGLMVRHLACSGHRGLPETTARLVDAAIRTDLAGRTEPLVGFSCLADGADTLFARALLDAGGTLVVVVPAQRYREGLPRWHHATYDALWAAAGDVIEVGYVESDSRAHMAASQRMLSLADELVAVWDGQLARGYGGTADVVDAAREQHLPVTVVWPDGATRD